MHTKKKVYTNLDDVLMAFHHKMTNELRAEAVRLKFTTSGLEVLRYVAESGNPTMKDIARKLSITPPSATTIVETLIGRQLLKRELDVTDRRIVRIVLAPKAWKFFTQMKDKKLTIMKNLFAKLNEQDTKELMRILQLLID